MIRGFGIIAAIAAIPLFAVPVPASAQEADAAAEPEDPAGWKLSADLAFTDISGNQEVTVFTTGVTLTRLQTELYQFEIGGEARYARSGGEEVAEEIRGESSFVLYPGATYSPFAFAAAEQNPFRQLDLRVNAGGGVKYELWRSETGRANASVAALYSYSDYAPPDPVPPAFAGIERAARWQFQVQGYTEITPTVRFDGRFGYQPVFDAFGDYLMTAQGKLTVAVSERIGLTAQYTFERNSDPVGDVEPNDRFLQVGLKVTTQW